MDVTKQKSTPPLQNSLDIAEGFFFAKEKFTLSSISNSPA